MYMSQACFCFLFSGRSAGYHKIWTGQDEGECVDAGLSKYMQIVYFLHSCRRFQAANPLSVSQSEYHSQYPVWKTWACFLHKLELSS